MENTRYIVSMWHSEVGSVYSVIDSWQPEDEQPAVVHSWNTAAEPNAAFLASDFCDRHNR